METKKYSYKSKTYNLRKTSFKPFRVKALKFIQAYRDFEKDYTKDLQEEIQSFLFSNKKANGKIISASNSNDSSKLNKAITDVLTENPEYAIKAQELSMRKDIAKELFLTSENDGTPSDVNAKELCEIMFDNASTINHNPQTAPEYLEYIQFIFKVFDDFFFTFERLKNIVL